jgi:bifunctional non-homologous end joining protein LigD
MGLEEYRRKRDFQRTAEPQPKKAAGKGPLTFVVQKHRAHRLHYDFRLEVDGVLKSWAVPKGPSLDPGVRRLAMMVEDHPLEYAAFEGVIPEGEYGAGEVIVWDSGTYSPDEGGGLLFHDRAAAEKSMRRGIEAGQLSVFLRGKKLKGSWALVKIRKKDKEWLLIKHRDEFARPGSDILGDR